jgi:release factor glutamine methyltransferase
VRALLSGAGFANVFTAQDLAGHDRCSGGQWLDQNAGARSSLK